MISPKAHSDPAPGNLNGTLSQGTIVLANWRHSFIFSKQTYRRAQFRRIQFTKSGIEGCSQLIRASARLTGGQITSRRLSTTAELTFPRGEFRRDFVYLLGRVRRRI